MGTARLFIVEFDLADLSSHFFNQLYGFKQAAAERGLIPCVLVRKDVADSLAEPLDAHRVIEFEPAAVGQLDYELDSFAEGDRQLQALWGTMEDMAIRRDDVVLITSARPIVIYSLGAWLGRIDSGRRPATFIRCFDHDYLDLETKDYSGKSWMYRFAFQDLSLRPGQERVFLTANNVSLIAPLARLCSRRVFQMPLPKYYCGAMPDPTGTSASSAVIYTHINGRSGVMLDQIEPVIRAVLEKYPHSTFLLKYCLNAVTPGTTVVLSKDLLARGVELIPAEQSPSDHLRTIARSHIVFLPYEPTRYKALASGVFAEGAALGKVMVYPGDTWMADQIAEGHAAGVSFGVPNLTEASGALLQALGSLPQLLTCAQERSGSFRAHHSCGRNLDLMLTLARESHDMRLTYVPGSAVNFNNSIHSRGYMGSGWSGTESNGAWTDGPVAALFFRPDPKPMGPLNVRIRLTPLLADGRRQTVTISVNGVELCEWTFPGHKERYPAWRSVTIPSSLAASDEIRMRLYIRTPLSPRQLGVSEDSRDLGIMFHEMFLDDMGNIGATAPPLAETMA